MVSAQELRTSTTGTPAAEAVGLALAQKAGAPNLAALRTLDAAALVAAGASTGFFPFFVIDGHVLTRQIVDVFDRGEQARVPILAGFNESYYGFRLFTNLLEEAAKRGAVILERDENSANYRVRLPAGE